MIISSWRIPHFELRRAFCGFKIYFYMLKISRFLSNCTNSASSMCSITNFLSKYCEYLHFISLGILHFSFVSRFYLSFLSPFPLIVLSLSPSSLPIIVFFSIFPILLSPCFHTSLSYYSLLYSILIFFPYLPYPFPLSSHSTPHFTPVFHT
jgi:hypothetical protein